MNRKHRRLGLDGSRKGGCKAWSIVFTIGTKRLRMVHFVAESRCFPARPEAERLAAASPLSNPNTQHVCVSVGIAQGLSESIVLDLQLCIKSHAAARALEAQRMFTRLVCSPRP